MHRLLKFLICFSLLFSTTNPQTKGWRGIVPLQSAKADVELILGLPSKEAGHYAFYQFSNEVVTIWYAVETCDSRGGRGWKVARGTVVEITVSPTRALNVAELKLDLSKFKKEVNPHFPDESLYRNDKEGFGVETIREMVTALRYYPSEDQNHLRCVADDKQKQRQQSSITQLTAEEKAMIDRFMTCLAQETDSTGWIRIDIARRHAGDSDLTDMVFRFVKEKYSSKINRVSVMAGAFNQNQEIEFFVIPPDGKPMPFRP
ncbi:MAG: hypothetical protein ND895_28965 [Pyrinomonadaceae bacterium]|nr:hypothetical protein [Pyrinomonadaceae bacterium]